MTPLNKLALMPAAPPLPRIHHRQTLQLNQATQVAGEILEAYPRRRPYKHDGTLREKFEQWYPGLKTGDRSVEAEQLAA